MEQQIEVGDWVRININHWNNGLMGLVQISDDHISYPIVTYSHDYGQHCLKQEEVTLVSKAIKEPTKEIQVGDWVRVLPNNHYTRQLWNMVVMVDIIFEGYYYCRIPKIHQYKRQQEHYGTVAVTRKEIVKCHN